MTSDLQQEGLRVCLFGLGDESFGIRLDLVREIVPMAALSCPPSMPSMLEGFLNLGGTSVPVVRLAGLMGLSQQRPTLHTPLVIARVGALTMALLVDRVMGIVSVELGGLVPIANTESFNGCVEGQLMAADTAVHLLSLDRLFLAKERQTLLEFQAIETRRLRQMADVPS